ncbi:hypothetical protein Bca52824_055014 [Brassica carinata]|uniref:protein-serine/threonine phosphatase n=1 Tax=Brassica carinata TaxID=52824 RepID=A0A8X7REH5_BRACI|nr:hypothetical protein Bca52824_055014 [Brassica carinata]
MGVEYGDSELFVEFDEVSGEYLFTNQRRTTIPEKASAFRFLSVINCEEINSLRPFLREFLKEANKLFRMHVYTMGTYGYARYVSSVIDPGKRYFGNRVITREKSPPKKTLDRISADQRRVVIVDDNASVWPQHKPNLLQVSQYIYFRYQMTNNNSEEESYSYAEKKSDECRSNGALSNVLKLLQKAHTRFQQEEDSNELRLLIRY